MQSSSVTLSDFRCSIALIDGLQLRSCCRIYPILLEKPEAHVLFACPDDLRSDESSLCGLRADLVFEGAAFDLLTTFVVHPSVMTPSMLAFRAATNPI